MQGPATDLNAIRRIRDAVANGEGSNEEIYNYRRDGKGFWNALYVSPITDAEGRVIYFLGSQVDATRRKELALQDQSRLGTASALASGVRHEFDSLMHSAVANIQQARGASADPLQAGWLQEAEQTVRQAGKLTRQMLAFTEHQALNTQEVDLNEAVRGLDSLLTQVAGPSVEIQPDLSDEPAMAKLDSGQLELALVHLVRNASDAMPEGGTIGLRVWDYRSWGSAEGLSGQGWVELAVADNGEGMPSKTVRQAVEPFFSTRHQGKGIGLSLVQGILDRCGGRMQIETSPGRGTTVRLAFPQVEAV